jgi:hypothetical protein
VFSVLLWSVSLYQPKLFIISMKSRIADDFKAGKVLRTIEIVMP